MFEAFNTLCLLLKYCLLHLKVFKNIWGSQPVMAVQTGSCPSAKVRPALLNQTNQRGKWRILRDKQVPTMLTPHLPTCTKTFPFLKPGPTCAKNVAKCHSVLVYSVPMKVLTWSQDGHRWGRWRRSGGIKAKGQRLWAVHLHGQPSRQKVTAWTYLLLVGQRFD